MATTGAVFPGTAASVDRAGSTAWTNPGNAVSDNGSDTTSAVPTDYLVLSNFGFAVPSDATILGVTVRVEASETGTGASNYVPQLISAATPTLIGSAKSAVAVNGTTKVISTNGGASDVWSAALTPSVVNNSGFGVAIWSTDTTNTLAIDYVTVEVAYEVRIAAPTGVASTGSAGSFVKSNTHTGIVGAEATASAGTATVAQVEHEIELVGLVNSQAFGTQAVRGTFAAVGFANSSAFGTQAVSATVAPTGIASTNAFGAFAVAGTISAVSLESGNAFGAISFRATIAPAGVASSVAFGAVDLRATIAVAGYENVQAFGQPTVEVEVGGDHTITADGIPSAVAFGRPTVVVAVRVITGPWFPLLFPHFIEPNGLRNRTTFGTPAVKPQTMPHAIGPARIVGGAFGQPRVYKRKPPRRSLRLRAQKPLNRFGCQSVLRGPVVRQRGLFGSARIGVATLDGSNRFEEQVAERMALSL